MRQSQVKATIKYTKEHLRQVMVKFNKDLEPGLTDWIEQQENKQGYIKSLILADMQKHKQST